MSASDPRYDHRTFEIARFASRDELTKLAAIALDSDTSPWKLVINAIRIASVMWIFKVRKDQFQEEQLRGKNIYERERDADRRDDLDDDMDGLKPAST